MSCVLLEFFSFIHNIMNDEKNSEPIMSIGPDGIKINTQHGNSVKTNSTQTYMKGVKQTSDGGEISHKATKGLVQRDNEMKATDKGKIINEVDEGGLLHQEGNKMITDKKGKIINRAKSKTLKISLVIVPIGLIANVITLLSFWQRLWDLLKNKL